MIEIRNLAKTYHGAEGDFTAVKNINLTINDGDIFGIIGLSGAGKSTLVRCINLLEVPTEGDVLVDGKSMLSLSRRELLAARQKIGMIFQGFNLLSPPCGMISRRAMADFGRRKTSLTSPSSAISEASMTATRLQIFSMTRISCVMTTIVTPRR